MIEKFLEKLDEQAQVVFGVKAKGFLSMYSVFAVLCVIVPLVSILFLMIF